MADLLFELDEPQRREREFRLHDMTLDNFTDEELRCRYRFGRESIEFLSDLLANDLQRPTRRNHALVPVVQLLVALRFYASGSFLQVIGDTVGLSKSAVSNIITNVSEALAVKKQQFITWPSQDEINVVKEGFYRKGGFPAVVGCIDGTHVRIQRPTEHENDFVNRKGYHSVNVQAICNHKGMFTNVVAKWPGSTHDSFVFRTSQIGQWLDTQVPVLDNGVLLGDSGYPCKPYLMTPYLHPSTAQQEAFNRAHVSTRVAVEQAFGWWKRRFHVLHGEIRMKPEKVCTVIGACAVLHNIAISRKEPVPDLILMDQQPVVAAYHGPENGKAIRDHICNTFF